MIRQIEFLLFQTKSGITGNISLLKISPVFYGKKFLNFFISGTIFAYIFYLKFF